MYSCPSIVAFNFFVLLFCGVLPRASDANPIADYKPIDLSAFFRDILRSAISQAEDVVRIDHYYESFCPDCIAEYPEVLEVVQKFQHQIDLRSYPYGNAHMTNENGTIIITCQHGEKECYGNKLHACAIDQLKDFVTYVPFINCLMNNGSDDTNTDDCGATYDIDAKNIKSCAKGKKGEELLEYYGNLSKKVGYSGVPYVLVNGQEVAEQDTLFDAVCGAFHQPPDVCNEIHERPVTPPAASQQCNASDLYKKKPKKNLELV